MGRCPSSRGLIQRRVQGTRRPQRRTVRQECPLVESADPVPLEARAVSRFSMAGKHLRLRGTINSYTSCKGGTASGKYAFEAAKWVARSWHRRRSAARERQADTPITGLHRDEYQPPRPNATTRRQPPWPRGRARTTRH